MMRDRQPRLTAPGYADREPTKPPNWHELVVFDMLFNALATGLFLTAALAELTLPDVFGPVVVWAYPLALLWLLGDLTCLILDLGNPLRFHHMLRVFKPLSPMSLGTWFLTAFSLTLTVIVAVDLLTAAGVLPADSALVGGFRMVFVVLALPLALGASAYKGVLFSTTSQPGWRDARWLGSYHLVAALALGAMELLVLAMAAGPERATTALRPAAVLLLLASLLPLLLSVAAMRTALMRRYTRNQLVAAAGLVVVVGTLVPVAALLASGTGLLLLGAACTLIGALAARHVLVMLPQFAHHSQAGQAAPTQKTPTAVKH